MLKYLIGSQLVHISMSFSSVLAPTIRHLCGDVDRPRLGGSMGLQGRPGGRPGSIGPTARQCCGELETFDPTGIGTDGPQNGVTGGCQAGANPMGAGQGW